MKVLRITEFLGTDHILKKNFFSHLEKIFKCMHNFFIDENDEKTNVSPYT